VIENNKKLKVIYSAYQLPILEILHQRLQNSFDVEMTYVLTDTKYEEEFQNKFPDAIYHSIFKSRKGLPAKKLGGMVFLESDDDLLSFMDESKSIALDIMGREDKDGWCFSYAERKWHFLWLIKYWHSVLKHVEPSILISRNIPHFASEYVLFKVCEYFKIPCLTIEDIAPLGLSYITRGISGRSKPITDGVIKGSHESSNPSENVEKFIDKIVGKHEEAMPGYLVEIHDKRKNDDKLWHQVSRLVIDVLMTFAKGATSPVYTNIKMNKYPIYDKKSWLNQWKYRVYVWSAKRKIGAIKKLYRSYTEPMKTDVPYVFFAPNYQPERTTLPDAGKYGDMLYLLDALSDCMPKDWVIYYKEHPTIFLKPGKNFFRGHLYRGPEFYERLSGYKNIKFIDERIPAFSVIDGAKAAITATGTVAYEASIRGVPAIALGEFWACGCDAILRVENRSQLKDAFKKIESGYSPVKNDWYDYLESAEKVSFKSVHALVEQYEDNNLMASMVSEINRLADNYIDYINKHALV